jgi:hypothetical protein
MQTEWEGIVQREQWDLFNGIRVGPIHDCIILDWYPVDKNEYEQLVGKRVKIILEVIE